MISHREDMSGVDTRRSSPVLPRRAIDIRSEIVSSFFAKPSFAVSLNGRRERKRRMSKVSIMRSRTLALTDSLAVQLSVGRSVGLSVSQSVTHSLSHCLCLSVCLSVCASICSSICVLVRPSPILSMTAIGACRQATQRQRLSARPLVC